MHKRIALIFIMICVLTGVCAQDVAHTSMAGTDSIPAEFFRKWYHRSDLIYYLEALNDHTILETTTYGQWSIPDRMAVAIEGLPCTANRYYIDGFRVDNRYEAGSTFYRPNMERYNLDIATHTAQMYFSLDSAARDYIELTGNVGQLSNGEPAAGTKAIFNITHRSPMESADTWKHITARRHIRGAGSIDAAYTFYDRDSNAYRQHIYAAMGQRLITRENHTGLILENPLYPANYYTVQADGTLCHFPSLSLNYRLNFSGREDAGSEFLYNYNEVYNLKHYSGSVYLKHPLVTTGLTWGTHAAHHTDLSFSRNILDQDGESFEPWVPDGKTHELNWAVNYSQAILPWLSLHVDAYNSLILFSPEKNTFSNAVYMQSPVAANPTPLYTYQFESQSFAGGILENTIGLKANHPLCSILDLSAHVDFTLDGMLLSHKSKISPFAQAGFNFDLHPCKWFEMGLSLEHERLPYNIEQLRFFSDEYLNASIYLQDGTLMGTMGGRYHHYKNGLIQTSYLNLDIPIRFHFDTPHGRHEVVLQQSYKKFFNVWHTYYQGDISNYGSFREEDGLNVFYPYPGVKEYEVGVTEPFGKGIVRNSPYYFSQLTRYIFTGRKVLVSLSWQSMQASGYTGLGNGAMSNTIGMLSESTANPNTSNVTSNQAGKYRGVGRMDLDKGFVCRFYLAYNICPWLDAGLTIKWTDGKPFTDYRYFYDGTQVAILPTSSRGTNPTDNNFGKRHCAKYNFDLHLQGKWMAGDYPMSLRVECYNIWDFCHDLAEMSFVQDIPQATRASMIMDIPIGLLATFKVDL